MSRLCGACSGLLVFSAMIVCGLAAGNAVEVIVQRALWGMLGGLLLGGLAGYVAEMVVRENTQVNAEKPADENGTAEAGPTSPGGSA